MNEDQTYQSLRDYLEKTGVLVNANPAEIAEAKKAYRRYYMRQYKRIRRGNKLEVVITIPKGFHKRLQKEAARHGLTLSKFLLKIIHSYIDSAPVIHHPSQYAKLQQEIALLHSELTFMGDQMIGEPVAIEVRQLAARIEAIEVAVANAAQSISFEDFFLKQMTEKPWLKKVLIQLLEKQE